MCEWEKEKSVLGESDKRKKYLDNFLCIIELMRPLKLGRNRYEGLKLLKAYYCIDHKCFNVQSEPQDSGLPEFFMAE